MNPAKRSPTLRGATLYRQPTVDHQLRSAQPPLTFQRLPVHCLLCEQEVDAANVRGRVRVKTNGWVYIRALARCEECMAGTPVMARVSPEGEIERLPPSYHAFRAQLLGDLV